MRGRPSPVDALVTLPEVADAKERQARWRQAVTALAQYVRPDGPSPLDGLGADQLVHACQAALTSGLVDDLDWIDPGAAAVALYELTTALPLGNERREFARRVFGRLYEGNAATFLPVATRMALGSGKQLEKATMHARVSLLLQLPIGSSVRPDSLALSLILRREQFAHWVREPSTGRLPGRRLAAVIFDRASREAVARWQRGDHRPREVLFGGEVRTTFDALYADREPLVWRHVAVARGFLSAIDPKLRQNIDTELDPKLTPTEWRRAVVSLLPCLLWDYETTMAQCRRIFTSDIVDQHPAIVSTMLWGLGPVIEAEPEAAEEVLALIASCDRLDVSEAMANLLGDVASPNWALWVTSQMRASLAGKDVSQDRALGAIVEHVSQSLEQRGRDGQVRAGILAALNAFEVEGARAAYGRALETLDGAEAALSQMAGLDSSSEQSACEIYPWLSDLDAGALERSRLHDLLLLGRRPGDGDQSVPRLEVLYDTMGSWLVSGEESEVLDWAPSAGMTLYRQKRLLTLLHLVDIETSGSNEAASERVKQRLRRAIRCLLHRLSDLPVPTALRRVNCATLARCFDAAVREHVADPADLLLLLMQHVHDPEFLAMLLEASTHSDVRDILDAYTRYVGQAHGGEGPTPSMKDMGDFNPWFEHTPRQTELGSARHLVQLSSGIGTDGSYRGEALRQVVLRLGRSLEGVLVARSLAALTAHAKGEGDVVAELEDATDALRALFAGASRRVLDEAPSASPVGDTPPLSTLLERAVSAGQAPAQEDVTSAIDGLIRGLPPAVMATISSVLGRISRLPLSTPTNVALVPLKPRRPALPDWLLPRRTIGGFYVVRALGEGGVSSVFIARRIEDRNRSDAERYALKVPHYDPNTARSLSEQEFMELFRQEASALLSLPHHGNLAGFVTFDLAATPKPILVMELIPGESLDRLIRKRSLTYRQALSYFDGLLSGLEAMHKVGVAHLDVKPSNVVLRTDGTPALVDFGLSGRQLRPGCGTLEYRAPEVLGGVKVTNDSPPSAADMYAVACTGYELFTAEPLFQGFEETALIRQQMSHDGWPKRLAQFGALAPFSELAVLLGRCLRREPRNRLTAGEARRLLQPIMRRMPDVPWPMSVSETARGMTA